MRKNFDGWNLMKSLDEFKKFRNSKPQKIYDILKF